MGECGEFLKLTWDEKNPVPWRRFVRKTSGIHVNFSDLSECRPFRSYHYDVVVAFPWDIFLQERSRHSDQNELTLLKVTQLVEAGTTNENDAPHC